MITDEIVPVRLDTLRQIYVDHLTDLTGSAPSIEDWYRFELAVLNASLVKVRELAEGVLREP